jgi:predicted Zn-dependent peptidase
LKKGYSKTVLPNGVRVISERVPSIESISVGVWVHVGSRDEPGRLSGISHFIEHILFKGTRKRSPLEIAKALESLGGTINAFTSRENTCYYVRILRKHLPKAMEILSDLLNNSLLAPADLRKERQVILEEIKDVADAPGDYVHDLFAEQMFNSHPLGRPIMGKSEAVKSLRRAAVLDYMKQHYCSPNVLVAGTGAISHQALVDLTRKYFKWPKIENGKIDRLPEPSRFSIKAHKNGSMQTHVCLGFPSVSYPDPSRYAMSALNTYLSSGMSARLFQKVREEAGYCYTIYSYQEFFRDCGLFCVYFGSDDKFVVRATNIVLKELHRLKEKLLNRADVGKIKEQLKGSLMLSQESMYNRMNRIAHQELILGSYIDLDTHCHIIDKITASQVREAANRIFDAERLTFCSLGPMKRKALSDIRWSAL